MNEFADMKKLLGSDPLVSIVLPTLNGGRYIATSIESCLQQSYQNFELIAVVDGKTTDNTVEIIKGFSDSRIQILYNDSSAGGLPGSLNIGFSHARGDYYTWTSDDNYYKEDALEVMVSYLVKNPDVGLVYTGIWFVDDDSRIIRESKLMPPESLLTDNPVGSCFLYRREVAEKVGMYDENIRMVEDADYWMRVYKQFKLALIKERYYYHRLHGNSLTGKNYGEHLAHRRLAEASKKHFNISWLKYQQLIAEAFIEEAFDAYQKKDFKHVLPCLLKGVVRDLRWFGNRGIYSIGIQSLSNIFWRAQDVERKN